MSGKSHILQAKRKNALRLLTDLYSANNTFRSFAEFALIGAIVLFFIHGYQSASSIGKAARGAAVSTMSAIATPDEADIVRFARRGALAPKLSELGLEENYFSSDPEPLHTQLVHAWRYYRKQDLAKAFEILDTLQSDHPHVLLVKGMATMARPENGMLRNGVLYLEQAAAKSDLKAMAILGVMHIIGTPGLQHDLERGQKLIASAAAKGDVSSTRVVGQGYLSGWMGAIDPARAAKYLAFAADRGDTRATLQLADLYYTGRGVTKNELEGDRLAERAANQGDIEAQALVGARRMQAFIAGITDDPSDALSWLERAAQNNEVHAVELLANFYFKLGERIGKTDIVKGLEVLKRCVEQSRETSCAMVYAKALDNGLGGVRDVKTIYSMYQLANRDGRNDAARARLTELGKEISTSQRLQIDMESKLSPVSSAVNCKFGSSQPC